MNEIRRYVLGTYVVCGSCCAPSEIERPAPRVSDINTKPTTNDSPRDSAVEASRRRLKRGAGDVGGRTGATPGHTDTKDVVLIRKREGTTVTPLPGALYSKPCGAVVGDDGGLLGDKGLSVPPPPLLSAAAAAAEAEAAESADGSARHSSCKTMDAGEDDERERQRQRELPLGLGGGCATRAEWAEREEAPRVEDKSGTETGTAVGVVVPAPEAAAAAAVAAADREANLRFQSDGPADPAEGRALTRREQEGLRRRALAENSLVSSKSWVNSGVVGGVERARSDLSGESWDARAIYDQKRKEHIFVFP